MEEVRIEELRELFRADRERRNRAMSAAALSPVSLQEEHNRAQAEYLGMALKRRQDDLEKVRHLTGWNVIDNHNNLQPPPSEAMQVCNNFERALFFRDGSRVPMVEVVEFEEKESNHFAQNTRSVVIA